MAIQVEVWGDYACFTRPEMKTERVSYDVMTPSAARGLLESIYWHPGLRWVIDRIHVCAPHPLHQHPPQRGQGCHQRPQGEDRDGKRAGGTVPRRVGRAFNSARLWCCGMYTMSSTRTST